MVGVSLTFDDLLRQAPLIHNDRTRTWGIHSELAEFLDRHVEPEMVALETGAGLSTLVILRKRPRLHVAVQPCPDEFAAIVEFANAHAIDTRPLRAIVARSQDYLPTVDVPPLDLMLIDGDHSFPSPFVDWFYTAERLKVGGLMIVDDIQIATGTILAAFLAADPRWETVVMQPERFAIYRKRVESVHLGDWVTQPFLRDPFPTAAVHLVPHGALTPRELEAKLAAAEERTEALATHLAAAEERAEALSTHRDHAEAATRRAVEELEATRSLLRDRTAERDREAAAALVTMARIRTMESTKFWKLRRVWFRLRRLVGAPGHE